MVARSQGDRTEKAAVLDPITGKPLIDQRINPLVSGPEELPEELDDEISGPEDLPVATQDRSHDGVQLIAHIEDPEDISEMLPKLRDKWKQARKDLGLDD
jgi:hypothetical protein